MTDKVVSFPGSEPLPPNLIESIDPKRHSFCKHERIELDEHERTAKCSECGRVLDPFNFLRDNARTLQMAWRNHATATTKVKDLMERIEALTKEHKSLQGKVSRLRDKVPTVDTRGKDKL